MNSQVPLSTIGRMMLFVDGENLACRFQSLLSKGLQAHKGISHYKDVYVWNSNFNHFYFGYNLIRTFYYTSVIGDDVKVAEITEQISALQCFCDVRFTSGYNTRLTPIVFKRKNRTRGSKAVDMKLCADLLSNVLRSNVDAVHLLSGDGDFLPIVEEAKRAGVAVYISAFSDGLSPELRSSADSFRELDGNCFILY